jgi:hypothetical protein
LWHPRTITTLHPLGWLYHKIFFPSYIKNLEDLRTPDQTGENVACFAIVSIYKYFLEQQEFKNQRAKSMGRSGALN